MEHSTLGQLSPVEYRADKHLIDAIRIPVFEKLEKEHKFSFIFFSS
jgi:hypothetical protein